MPYYLSKTLDGNFAQLKEKVTEALKQEGFGVLTELDMKTILKNKLDVDFRDYLILGACNPQFAFQALKAEDKIGLMLPCNVILQQLSDGKVEIAIIDPVVAMKDVDNQDLEPFAVEVKEKLERVIDIL